MNRRSFIKTITGFVVGVYAAFVPGKTVADIRKARDYLKKNEREIIGGMIKRDEFENTKALPHLPPYKHLMKFRRFEDIKETYEEKEDES